MAAPATCHDLRCDDPEAPAGGCGCRDQHGKTPHHADQRLADRWAAEQAWHQLTPCERADAYDRIASTPQTGATR